MADHTTECPYCAATFEPDELTRLRGAMIESLRRDRSEDTKRPEAARNFQKGKRLRALADREEGKL